jgi:N4-gp56 family major capsid protein|tara:strand:+ start:6993 stop:7847 length:855 start_codon:yes stop_codon:yes gene_type:complete
MANEATGSVLSELYANIVQSALYTLSEQTVIRPLIRNYDMSGTPGLTAQVPIYPAISAAAIADGTDLANTAFNTTSKTMTASEIGVMVELTDLAAESATDDVAAAIGRQIGDAMAKKVDADLAALFTGFSANVNKTSAAVTVDDIFKAAATLRANQAPGNYVAVLHPYQAYDLKAQLTNAGATMSHSLSEVGNRALMDGFIGRIAGVDIFESTVVSAPDSAGAYYGAVMTQDALGYMVKRSMRIETERNASKRSLEIVGSMAFGVSEIFDGYGVGIISDATAVL